MALEINLGDIYRIKNCCIGDYLLHSESLKLYRIIKGLSIKGIFVIDVEDATTTLCFDNITDLKNSDFYKNTILIPESEFELIRK